ncbi:MAG: DUF4340 domain-containing protein [Saprospiraceae bacterium]
MNNKTLLFIFLGLLAIYGLSQVFTGKRTSNFNTELIKIDTTQITQIIIQTKPPSREEIMLQKEAKAWIVSNGTVNTTATPTAVNALLSNLQLIKTKYIAANSEEKWADYEVGEQQGIRIQLFNKGTLVEDFITGRFTYDQQAQTGTSYIRLSSGKEVYAVDGFQTLTLGQGFNSYRNRTLSNISPEVVFTNFSLENQDTVLRFIKTPSNWMIGEQALDSAKVVAYLQQLSNLRGDSFADDFDEIQAPNFKIGAISLGNDALNEALKIEIYQDTGRLKPFIFRSSFNPEAWFESDSTGLYQQLVKEVADFLPTQGDPAKAGQGSVMK